MFSEVMGISRNIAILIASGAVRNLGFGFYNVIFAIYLSKLGFGKQSYMMALVPREERARARGFTTVFQWFSGSFSPSVAAHMMSAVSTSLPFYLGGAIQFTHDILYYYTFRDLKPPEELSEPIVELSADRRES